MMPESGKVYIIGAGPGDPSLVTVRARELIERADVILYDYLANPSLLTWARTDAEKIYVGKRAGKHSMPQDEIEALLIERAGNGQQVVRLKGGDPYVFGRGGEEVTELLKSEIPFEIVPGVTAALAAAAYAGIPLSHREYSQSITLLTGHEDPQKHTMPLDYRQYGKDKGTLCLYMAFHQLPRIIAELKEGGMCGETPVAVIQWATLNNQRSVYSTIDKVLTDIESEGIGTPAMILIGQVVAKRSKTEWFEGRPLFGRRILVTRAREQAGELTQMLKEQGADVLELPFIQIEPHYDPNTLTEVFAEMAVYEWIIFTSVNGVRTFFELFYKAYDDIRCLGPMRVAAVGAATAREIKKHHIKVDLIPDKANADALANKMIEEEGVESIKILVVTGNQNRESLVKRLEEEGRAIVDTLPLYKTSRSDLQHNSTADRFRKEGADAVLFTSSSTVKSFVEQQPALELEKDARQPAYGSIGPVTSKTLKELNLPVAFESARASLEHFVVETISHLNSK